MTAENALHVSCFQAYQVVGWEVWRDLTSTVMEEDEAARWLAKLPWLQGYEEVKKVDRYAEDVDNANAQKVAARLRGQVLGALEWYLREHG